MSQSNSSTNWKPILLHLRRVEGEQNWRENPTVSPYCYTVACANSKIRINGIRKDYKFLKWLEASLQKTPPEIDYFSSAEQYNGTEEATNTNYKDLLLTLQSHQSNKLTSIAHSAEINFNNRRNRNSAFGREYAIYWEERRDQALEANIINDARETVSSIQHLVNEDIRERARNAFCRSSIESNSSDLQFLDPGQSTNNNFAKVLEQASNLASDVVGQLRIIDLSSHSVIETIKANITEEEYLEIDSTLEIEKVELSKSAEELIEAINAIKIFSYRTVRNTLYKYGYQLNYDPIEEYDLGIAENLVLHFLDLIDSPNNPLNTSSLERTAAVHTSIAIINQLFLWANDIIELGWLERECYATNKTKWDWPIFISNKAIFHF